MGLWLLRPAPRVGVEHRCPEQPDVRLDQGDAREREPQPESGRVL